MSDSFIQSCLYQGIINNISHLSAANGKKTNFPEIVAIICKTLMIWVYRGLELKRMNEKFAKILK